MFDLSHEGKIFDLRKIWQRREMFSFVEKLLWQVFPQVNHSRRNTAENHETLTILCDHFLQPHFYERLSDDGKIVERNKYLMQIAWEHMNRCETRSNAGVRKIECSFNPLSINSRFCFVPFYIFHVYKAFLWKKDVPFVSGLRNLKFEQKCRNKNRDNETKTLLCESFTTRMI